ncbi:MAG: hypothetical protein JNM55_19910 [Anaerolineales bacterium]|nr:hypothetical protein [Anaerolineales bacterium]
MKKFLPLTLIIFGTVLVIVSVVLWLTLNVPTSSKDAQLSVTDWITIIVGVSGLGASIKGWIDLFKKDKPSLPNTMIEVNDGKPQISTGSNSRNIQTEVYIETQVVQQVQVSEWDERSNVKKELELDDDKNIDFKIKNGARVRFLDALDSARFSSKQIYQESRLFSVVYVKVQFFFALMCGDSIVVTENQLFDSLGFLETFYELHKSLMNTAQVKTLPIKVALREGDSVFETVAKHIENKGFELTLWEELNIDIERRKLWADRIRNKQKPIGKLVVNAKEKKLVERLWTILEYFTPEYCVRAEKTDEFSKRVKLVIDQDDLRLNALVTGIYKEGVEERRYLDTWDEVKAAKEIRDALKIIQDKVGVIDTRSKVRKQLEGFENIELRQGVIELTDGLYNQSLGVASRAKLVQNSTFPPQRNDHVAAGYALSTFVNDKSNPSGDFVDSEIFSFDYFDNLQRLDDPKHKKELFLILETAQKSAPWEKLIEIRERESWMRSLVKFNSTLAKLQLAVRKNKPGSSLPSTERIKLINELDNLKENLKRDWDHHIENISDILSNDCWRITPTEVVLRHPNVGHVIRIPYSHLQPKIDREYIDGFKTWRNNTSFKGVLDGGFDLPS